MIARNYYTFWRTQIEIFIFFLNGHITNFIDMRNENPTFIDDFPTSTLNEEIKIYGFHLSLSLFDATVIAWNDFGNEYFLCWGHNSLRFSSDLVKFRCLYFQKRKERKERKRNKKIRQREGISCHPKRFFYFADFGHHFDEWSTTQLEDLIFATFMSDDWRDQPVRWLCAPISRISCALWKALSLLLTRFAFRSQAPHKRKQQWISTKGSMPRYLSSQIHIVSFVEAPRRAYSHAFHRRCTPPSVSSRECQYVWLPGIEFPSHYIRACLLTVVCDLRRWQKAQDWLDLFCQLLGKPRKPNYSDRRSQRRDWLELLSKEWSVNSVGDSIHAELDRALWLDAEYQLHIVDSQECQSGAISVEGLQIF